MILLGICLTGVLSVALADDTKANYQLGPQDEITVTVLRHPELTQSYTVPPDGNIDFPRAERLHVLGKTMAEVADALKQKYATFLLAPDVSVVLTKARVKYASVLGAVSKPGQYPIGDTTRVTELLASAGDLLGERKELSATLKRGNADISVNLQSVLNGTDPASNVIVRENDLLQIIAPLKVAVTVGGKVKDAGQFQLRTGSTVAQALAAAGDVTESTDRAPLIITLTRGNQVQRISWSDATMELREGDIIHVEEDVIKIFVSGQVKQPGGYAIPSGCGVMQAISQAGGQLPTAALRQVTIMRQDGTSERVDLADAFAKGGTVPNNPTLHTGDQVVVPEWTSHFSVFGAVNKAGSFDMSEQTPVTVVDAISMAGVDNKKAKLSDVVVIRTVNNQQQRIDVNVNDILKKGKNNLNIALQDHDVVYVPDTQKTGDVLTALYQLGIIVSVL
jgi:polysaccharide export outer membrane protein